MVRLLLPVALLSVVCLAGQDALAHHHRAGNNRQAAGMVGNQGFATPSVVRYGYAGFAPSFYPGYVPSLYPGVGYVSRVTPGLPGNIYTQSYFNSPNYGHWNGFGNGK